MSREVGGVGARGRRARPYMGGGGSLLPSREGGRSSVPPLRGRGPPPPEGVGAGIGGQGESAKCCKVGDRPRGGGAAPGRPGLIS